MKDQELKDLAINRLGHLGRMVCASKGRYLYNYPNNVVSFNANVVVNGKKVWYGDIDLTEQIDDLHRLAKDVGSRVYVIHETAGRFENENSPDISDPLIVVNETDITFLSANGKYRHIVDGVPYVKKEESLIDHTAKYLQPTDEYKKEDFTAVKLPDMKEFAGGKRKGNPLELFQKFLIDKYGKVKAQAVYLSISWRYEDELGFGKVMETYLKKVEKMDGYELQKTMSWLKLDTPSVFQGTPAWSKPGYLYIKKEALANNLKKGNDE